MCVCFCGVLYVDAMLLNEWFVLRKNTLFATIAFIDQREMLDTERRNTAFDEVALFSSNIATSCCNAVVSFAELCDNFTNTTTNITMITSRTPIVTHQAPAPHFSLALLCAACAAANISSSRLRDDEL